MHPDEDDDLPRPRLLPAAEVNLRLLAGGVDFLAQLLLVGLYFAFPLMTGGAALPIWGVFAAVVGYAVVPLALYGATPGMAAFGLELVSATGRPTQVIDLLFRELLGRGYFPLAYLGSLLVALVGSLLGLTRFTLPGGVGLVLFLLSVSLLFAALAGNLLALVREDGRTLADLLARTQVIARRPREAPKDPEEEEDRRRNAARALRRLVIAEVCMLAIGLGVPWLMSRKVDSGDSVQYAERLIRERLEARFEQDPTNAELGSQLMQLLRDEGRDADAEAVRRRYQAALTERDRGREAGLRRQLELAPTDASALWALVGLLEEQGRKDEAKTAYAKWVDQTSDPRDRAGYGIWLYQTGYTDDAIVALTAALDAGVDDAEALAYRGFAFKERREYQKARADFQAALDRDPSLDEVRAALEVVYRQ